MHGARSSASPEAAFIRSTFSSPSDTRLHPPFTWRRRSASSTPATDAVSLDGSRALRAIASVRDGAGRRAAGFRNANLDHAAPFGGGAARRVTATAVGGGGAAPD